MSVPAASATLPADPTGVPATDFWFLRERALELLQRVTDQPWTDFNAADPGVTILEALCYAITDVAYRAGHSVPDLLADQSPNSDLPSAAAVLSCAPVTVADLRRIVLDTDGVRNAWVERVDSTAPQLYSVAGRDQASLSLTFEAHPPATVAVPLRGLYRVAIEQSEYAAGDVVAAVTQRLNGARNVGHDFDEIRVLPVLPVRITTTVEIDVVDRPSDVTLAILEVAAEYFSPTLTFRSLPEMISRGYPMDEIFEGPALRHGFLDPADLARYGRRGTARSSDLIAAINALPGVRDVRSFRLGAGSAEDDWAINLDPQWAPQLDVTASQITLVRGGTEVRPAPVLTDFVQARRLREATARPPAAALVLDRAIPRGRSRNVASYRSVQHELPRTYGVGESGLPDGASPARRSAAHNLGAYLLLFDQLLGDLCAQLAHVSDLLSPRSSDPATYFSQPPEVGPWSDGLTVDPAGYPTEIAEKTRELAGDALLDRRNRFLSQLLARQGEAFPDYGSDPGDTAASKTRLLTELPELAARRAVGTDYTAEPGPQVAGLQERVRRKIGLSDAEDFLLIEHILLRPNVSDDRKDSLPFLVAPVAPDPFSLQVTYVFPDQPARFAASSGFRAFVEQIVRAETPAHLRVWVRWIEDGPDGSGFAQLKAAHQQFLAARTHLFQGASGQGHSNPAAP